MRRYVLSSAAVHLSIVALMFLAGFFRPSQSLLMIEDVDFVGGGGGSGTTNTSGPKKENIGQVVPTPVKVPVPEKPAPIQKETVAKETWTVKKPETTPKEEKKDVERAETKKEETTNIIRLGKSPETKPGAGGFDFGDGSKGPAVGIGVGPGEGSGFAGFGSYLKVLRQRIWSEWSQTAVFGSNEMCIVGLTVSRSGDVSDIKIEKPSNNPFYDNVALRAVRNASPLPALPSSFPENSQRFRIQFRLIE